MALAHYCLWLVNNEPTRCYAANRWIGQEKLGRFQTFKATNMKSRSAVCHRRFGRISYICGEYRRVQLSLPRLDTAISRNVSRKEKERKFPWSHDMPYFLALYLSVFTFPFEASFLSSISRRPGLR
jgi:hypothetical protein